MSQKGYFSNPADFPPLGEHPVPVSTVTKTSQPSQLVPELGVTQESQPSQPVQESRVTQQPQTTQPGPTAEDLTRILAEWKDLPVAVILVGKLESLLTQSIVWDIYTCWNGDAESIVEDIRQFQYEVLEDAKYSDEEFVAEYPSEMAQLLQSMLDDIKKGDTTKTYTLSKLTKDRLSWFENLETLSRFSKGRVQTSDQAELKKMALGLMYEWVFLICERRYKWIIEEVPNKFLSQHEKSFETKAFRDIRHWIVHCRTYHGFKSEEEREKFINFYVQISTRFIKENDCFCLQDDYEARLSYT